MNTKVEAIFDRYQDDKGQLVAILKDIQNECHYLPKDALEKVSHLMNIPMSQIYSVATFFKSFGLKPGGQHLIHVCQGTTCQIRGAASVLEEIERDLGVGRGETTGNLKFTLETVNCMGACSSGPMVTIDGDYSGKMKTDKIGSVLHHYK